MFICWLLFLGVALAFCSSGCQAYFCLKQGKPRHWYFLYKLPAEHDTFSGAVQRGTGFLRLTSRGKKWRVSDYEIDKADSAYLAETLQQYYHDPRKQHKLVAFYNNQPPGWVSEFGDSHDFDKSKGVIMGDGTGIVFITHTVPGFPQPCGYKWPESEKNKADAILCLTLQYTDLEALSSVLLDSNVFFYYQNVPQLPTLKIGLLTKRFLKRGKTVSGMLNSLSLRTWLYGNLSESGEETSVKVFGLASNGRDDIFKWAISEKYSSHVVVWSAYGTTWDLQPGSCDGPFNTSALLAESIQLAVEHKTINGIKNGLVRLPRSSDRSNIALPASGDPAFVCVATLPRTNTALNRSGYAVCMEAPNLFNNFKPFTENGKPQCTAANEASATFY